MKTTKIMAILVLALVLIVCQGRVSEAVPMGMAFTYQGFLYDANSPANDVYDFKFELYDANNSTVPIVSPVTKHEVDVLAGLFTVELDFGSTVFTGDARWLQTGIRPGEQNDPCEYTLLTPRQELTPSPYAIYAAAATSLNAADGTPPNVVYVDEVGNVGINTMSPGAKLDVAGDQNLRGNLDFSSPLSTIGFANDAQVNASGDLTVLSGLSGSISAGTSLELDAAGSMGLQSGAAMTIATPSLEITAPSVDISSNLTVGGNIGIGMTTPIGRLQVAGDEVRIGNAGTSSYATGDGDLYVEDTLEVDGSVRVGDTSSDNHYLTGNIRLMSNSQISPYYNDTGYVGTSTYYWHATYANHVYYKTASVFSDEKVKKNIRPIGNPLQRIMNLQGRKFDLDPEVHPFVRKGQEEENKDNLGFIAQELLKVVPEMVSLDETTGLYVIENYHQLLPVVVEAMKEQQKQIEEKGMQIENLLRRIEALEQANKPNQSAR